MNWRFALEAPRKTTGMAFLCVTVMSATLVEANDDYTNGRGNPYAGDGLISWVDGEQWSDWKVEREKRQRSIQRYLYEQDAVLSKQWGYRQAGRAQSPYLGWKWFEEAPVGFGGVPFVVFKTINDLYRSN